MRLFVAIEIGEALATRAAKLSRELQRRADAEAPGAKITWVPADRLHLTVRFIGEVAEGQATAIGVALGAPVEVEPFNLTLCGAGTFPSRGTPRVIWVGVTDGCEGLLAVEREVTARLTPLGVPAEERAYNPHLTLARVREAAGLRAASLLDGLTDRRLGTVRIDAITLFQSRLSPRGPSYTPLLRVPCESPSS